MLNKDQLSRLNEQIFSEANVSRLYLAVSLWAKSKGLNGVASFFKSQHEDEEEHMHKLEDYIISTGGRVKFQALPAPPENFSSVVEVLKMSLETEIEVSKKINGLVDAFLREQDYSTFHFLQWYVAEQHEEEQLFRTLIEKAELIGEEASGLYWLDKELEKATPAPAAV